jgi:hypothetical protein
MKTILALAAALAMGTAYAQTGSSPLDSSTGTRHMFEFNADSVLKGVFSLDKSKTPGTSADNDSELDLRLNYAYQLPMIPRIQVGGRLNYLKDTNTSGDIENWGFQVGGIYNHSNDLRNSVYASLYVGMNWNKEYGSATRGGNYDDEVLISTIALGKRYSMEGWGIKHLTYTPEIALQNRNSTTGGDFEYNQSLQFRFLQFSVFF